MKEITVSGRKGKVKFKRSFIGVNAEIEAKKLEKRMTKAGFTVKTTKKEVHRMLDFVPDAQQLAQIFSNALAPTFFLGAVAAFVSLMDSRLSTVIERIRTLNEISDEDHARAQLKVDLERLRHRARYLISGIHAALRGGVCAALLLALMFTTGFLGIKRAYGAGLLFMIATAFLGFALIRFAQEARISLSEHDEYR